MNSVVHLETNLAQGVTAFGRADYPTARAQFEAALALAPNHVGVLNNLGCTLMRLDRFQEAHVYFARALALAPNDVQALSNGGAVLNELHRFDEALRCFERALALDPQCLSALNNLGRAFQAIDRLDDARACYDRLLALDPQHAEARYNRGSLDLAQGRLLEGFRGHVARWESPSLLQLARLHTAAPLWNGEASLEGKTILLYHEQGLGDTLQFVRYALWVVERAGQVVLRVPMVLQDLMTSLSATLHIISDQEPLPPHDYHCPLMSLPLVFGTTLETIPTEIPYLRAEPARVALWRQCLRPKTRPRIGVVWAGRQYPPRNFDRDMPLEALQPLFALPAEFISLQKDIPENDWALLDALPQLARHGESLTDFADTAGLIENLDLIIAVDTSVVHLAGALAKPVWILNRYVACWRWLRDRSDSPWYPTARLFRQGSPGDWAGVVREVKAALEAWLATRSTSVPVADVAVDLRCVIDLEKRGHHSEALAALDTLLAAAPEHGEALRRRAFLLTELDRNEEALTCAEQALALNSVSLDARNTRGVALEKLGRYDEAFAEFEAILAVEPDHLDALHNRGLVLARLGRFKEALDCFDRVLVRYPLRHQARYNRSLMRLTLGDFTRGFHEFESRWFTFPLKGVPHPSPVPLWLGQSSLTGKIILLYHEQGYGDSLQFIRYVPKLIERGAKVVLAVVPALKRLMTTLSGPVQVVTEGDPMPVHEWRCPLMSLPLAFGTTLESIPAEIPYLQADPDLIETWRERLGPRTRPRIGIVWGGRCYAPVNRPRDMLLKFMQPLFALNAEFVSLQQEMANEDRELAQKLPALRRFGEFSDFADTAALIEHLDLVISVDSAVAHLAGALGKPVWLMNRYATCWRWLCDRTDSPWYPTMWLFRQPAVGDWGAVVADVRAALEVHLEEGKSFSVEPMSTKAVSLSPPLPVFGMASRIPPSAPCDTSTVSAAEKIRFVCATRLSKEEFYRGAALGRSLLNFREFPKGQPIDVRLFPNNKASLPAVYNRAIDEAKEDPAILVFMHDDVLLCDFYWAEHLLDAMTNFSIVGLCGNKRRVPRQPSWMYLDDLYTCDDATNFSGIIGHGEQLPHLKQLSVYGSPCQEVKLLDGVMLAVRSRVLHEHDLRFDPQFDFDFYDLDFCRQAEQRGLRMGTTAISVVHQSSGQLGTPMWLGNYEKYLRKYGE